MEPSAQSAEREAASALASQAAEMAGEVKAAVLCSVEEKVAQQLGDRQDHAAALQSIHDMVLSDVDKKVAEKTDELWKRGQALLKSLQEKHKEKTARLTEEVATCLERQRTLEAENERLKEALQAVVSRFAQLGAVFSGVESGAQLTHAAGGSNAAATAAAAAFCTANATASTASTEAGSTAGTSSPKELFTPVTGRGAESSVGAAGAAAMPVIPPFPPFAAGSHEPATPTVPGSGNTLSLAEALGQGTPPQAATPQPHRTPLSLANSLASSPGMTSEGGGIRFKFTLRKADGTDLGLNVSHNDNEEALLVDSVRPGGAVDAWNRQCAGSGGFQGRAVIPGDRIVSVNNVYRDPQKMLEECRDKQLLKLEIARGEGAAAPAAVPENTSLRAEASVFVPRGSAATQEEELGQ